MSEHRLRHETFLGARDAAASPWAYAGQVALLAVVYWACARLALLLAIPPGYASPIWPASGIALAALLVLGRRLWPGVLAGSLAANLTVDASWAASVVIAAGSTFQALALATL